MAQLARAQADLRGAGRTLRSARRDLGLSMLAASLATGVAAGLGGVLMTLMLHGVQHLAFGYTEDTFLTGVERASASRRVIAVGVGGAVAGLGWWLHRRVSKENVSVTHALTLPRPRLAFVATFNDALLQIVAVGSGGSLGREGAPRQVGAAFGSLIAERFRLSPAQRRILLASGAGAGLASVYNVPLSGAAFTLEILLATVAPAAAVPAVITSVVATVTAWPFLGNRATYGLPATHLTATVVVAALALGPVAAAGGALFRALMTKARTHAPSHGPAAVAAMTIAFTLLGTLAIAYPQLLGNGKSMAQVVFAGSLSLGLAAALVALKPLATAACLGAGAIGGLLTPSFATGSSLGVVWGHVWSAVWPGGDPTAFALLGAASLLAVAQRAAITGVLLTVEFTHAPLSLLPAIALAVAAARLTEHLTRRAHSRWRARRPAA